MIEYVYELLKEKQSMKKNSRSKCEEIHSKYKF